MGTRPVVLTMCCLLGGWPGEEPQHQNNTNDWLLNLRYTGGLSVEKFLKKLTWQKLSKESSK
jgi:hypothetical protein